MEIRLMVTSARVMGGKDEGGGGGECCHDYKRATVGVLMVMELLGFLTVLVDTKTYTCNEIV